jgi:peptidyl-tRNA hydrolase, PTH1 family
VFVIAGLGNPGAEYDQTRHNIGYMVIDQLASIFRTRVRTVQCQALTASIQRMEGEPFILAKPYTFMNLSGDSISPLLKKLQVPPEKLIVIHDDLDLDCGIVRIKSEGSTAGHKGLKSIAERLGTTNFIRIRLGIGRPYEKEDVVDYVLSRFRSGEKAMLEQALDTACKMVLDYMDNGFAFTANKYHRKNTQET